MTGIVHKLSPAQARKIALHSQKIHVPRSFGRGKTGTLNAIDHLGYVQIDTISVVTRAHHHTLWNRSPDYRVDHLIDLQQQGKIFEYWSHAASFLPMRDYRFCLPRMHAIANGDLHWFSKDHKLAADVLQRIREEGPLQAKDFEHSRKNAATWWDWKPAKKALEQLYIEGKLMAVRGQNFQKTYDLTERLLPAEIDTTMPTPAEFARFLITRYLRANGIGRDSEIAYQRKGILSQIRQTLKQMASDQEIIPVNVAEQTYYCFPDTLELTSRPLPRKSLKILSPFDNLLIQRNRLKCLFDFDYQIECYVPAAKRKYGYFCLPLLWNGEFAGRMDAKAVRKDKTLLVRNLVLEENFKITDTFIFALTRELNRFSEFNGCEAVQIEKTSPRQLKAGIAEYYQNI